MNWTAQSVRFGPIFLIRESNVVGFTPSSSAAPSGPLIRQPPTLEQIRQRAQEIYIARGGAEGMALNDWLKAEQELKRKLEG